MAEIKPKKIDAGLTVFLTNVGESIHGVTDVFNRIVNVKPGQQVSVEVSHRTARILAVAANAGSLLKIADREGKPLEGPPPAGTPDTVQPVPEETATPLDAGIEPPKVKPAAKPPGKPQRVRPAPPPRAPAPEPIKSGTVVKQDVPPANDAEMNAAQVLARIGTTGFGYNELLNHGRRLIGADKLPPRPTEQDLLQRLRRLAAVGK